MDTFQTLKRRTTDLVGSIPSNAPSMPNVQLPAMPHIQMPSLLKFGGGPALKGTWQHVPLPPLPRSSHSVDVVAGSAYIFGGEVEPRKPVDNVMHVVKIPSSGAPADYYTIQARPASTATGPSSSVSSSAPQASAKPETIQESEEDSEDSSDTVEGNESKENLDDVSLASPVPAEAPTASLTSRIKDTADVPCSRVGHATAVIGSRIFLFGGRNSDSQTLQENGRVWVFSTRTNLWSHLDPHSSSPFPPARSYFAAVASDKPRGFGSTLKPLRKRTQSWKQWAEGDSADVGIPQAPIVGHVAENSTDEEEDGYGTFIIHGGCLADGGRTGDVWAFDVHSRTWKELPAAPGPARGGPCLTLAQNRLYRFGGYDGKGQQGGQLDVLELDFDESHSRAEVGVTATGGWHSTVFPSTTRTTTDDAGESTSLTTTNPDHPGNRSVACMNLVTAGAGREYLVLMLGERDASSLGHAGAGEFWSDVWAFQVPAVAGTAASLTDTLRSYARLVRGGGSSQRNHSNNSNDDGNSGNGKTAAEVTWMSVAMGPHDEDEVADGQGPGPRGWLDSAPMGDLEENGVVLFGGLSESNTRLGDLWIFRLE